jgi:hypothetical protein
MPAIKEHLIADIKKCKSSALDDRAISRKMFLFDSTFVFKEDGILGYNILNSISQRFRIPLVCVKVAGSAHTGFSSHKNREFIFGESDLDIALVSTSLFQRYCEIAYDVTNGYTNNTYFDSPQKYLQFCNSLQIGFFRPDLMPNCRQKTEWFTFFDSLTSKYSMCFKNINGGIYFSEVFFEGKQTDVVKRLIRSQ